MAEHPCERVAEVKEEASKSHAPAAVARLFAGNAGSAKKICYVSATPSPLGGPAGPYQKYPPRLSAIVPEPATFSSCMKLLTN